MLHLPPERISSAGDEAIALAESAGLVLDAWQQYVLREALYERGDGKWSAFEVALLVSRQNGKGSVLEALELAALFLFDVRLIVHSAHLFPTAQEHFLRMRDLIDGSDDLRRKVRAIPTANGKEAIILRSGARLKFLARTRGGGRGFTGDLLVLDEAYDLPSMAIGAMLPALSARPNPQVWYTSSAPSATSDVLRALVKRGRRGNAGRLFYAEWSADEAAVDDLDDRDHWYIANPALGIRRANGTGIDEEFVEAELNAMREMPREFARERLGVPDDLDTTAGVFGAGYWEACTDASSTIVGAPCFAVDVAPDMRWATIASAGVRSDELHHVEVVERRPGSEWVAGSLVEKALRWGASVTLDPKSPAVGLVADLEAAGITVHQTSALPKACAEIQHAVLTGTLRHLAQHPLDVAVNGAAIRTTGDAWVWTRGSSSVDISPLVAVTLALWAARHAEQAPVPTVGGTYDRERFDRELERIRADEARALDLVRSQ